jgi:ribosomal protein S18 acetylase RimI-like enzyme
MIRVRPAAVGDATAIAEVHVRSWQKAYRGIFPDDYLDGLDVAERAETWAARLSQPNSTIVVETGDGAVAGFASSGPGLAHDGTELAGVGQVYAIYLDPQHWGAGLARPLLNEATDRLRAAGFTRAVLWVARDNARARRFYEKEGWAADGTETVDTSFGPPVTETRYQRPL